MKSITSWFLLVTCLVLGGACIYYANELKHCQNKPPTCPLPQDKDDKFTKDVSDWINQERKRMLDQCIVGLKMCRGENEAIVVLCDDAIERCEYNLKKCRKLPSKKPKRHY